MPSRAQIDANRGNARRSTGPRTVQGKALSSRNAARHGLLARGRFSPTRTSTSLSDSARTCSKICGHAARWRSFSQSRWSTRAHAGPGGCRFTPPARPGLQDDEGGAGPPRGVGVEVPLLDVLPPRPKARALVPFRLTGRDIADRPTRQIHDGVGVCPQVEPPCGRGLRPAVHRHEDQVRTVLQVGDDHDSLRPRAAPGGPEPEHPPAVRSRAPQADAAAGDRVERPVTDPERADEPAWREPRGRSRRGHDPSMARASSV